MAFAQSGNLKINQGATYNATLAVRNSAGYPVNLSGYTTSGFIKYRYSELTHLATLHTFITSYVSGLVQIGMSAEETFALPCSTLVYDINGYSGSSVTRLLNGQLIIAPEVTY